MFAKKILNCLPGARNFITLDLDGICTDRKLALQSDVLAPLQLEKRP